MSNSPLNHKKRGGILGAAAGLFGGRKRKRNSNPNDSNTMNKLQNLSQKGGIHGAMGKLALQQQSQDDMISDANDMQQEALGSVEDTGVVNPIDIQKEQVAQAITRTQTNIQAAWYIRSFAGDYNPVHTHTDCQLTCVGYLKVPDLSKEREKILGNAGNAGALEILGPAGSNQSAYFESDRIGLIPKVGNWYLFPANLRHVVYPFKCDGERRSFSINLNTNIFRGVIAGQ